MPACLGHRLRSLKRWILPVAVFGKSARTSIQRGYFHAPAFSFTCAFNASSRRVIGRKARLQHDEGLRLDQLVLVLLADHRRFEHRLVRHQRGLDLERRDPDAAHLEHVVGTARGNGNSRPRRARTCRRYRSTRLRRCGGSWRAGSNSPRRPTARAPRARRSRRSSTSSSVLAEDLGIVARHRLAGGAVANVASARLLTKMCSISVEPMPSRMSTPTVSRHRWPDVRRQCLAGRDAQAQPVRARRRAPILVREHRRIERRHAVEDGRLLAPHELEHRVGRRPPGSSTALAPTDIGNDMALPSP